MKRGFPSSWFLKQSSPAGTAGNGDISGFELNKEGFGGCFGKVLVLSLGTLCPWRGLGKLLHCQSQDESAQCHWMTAVTGALEAGMLPRIVPALLQLWEVQGAVQALQSPELRLQSALQEGSFPSLAVLGHFR